MVVCFCDGTILCKKGWVELRLHFEREVEYLCGPRVLYLKLSFYLMLLMFLFIVGGEKGG